MATDPLKELLSIPAGGDNQVAAVFAWNLKYAQLARSSDDNHSCVFFSRTYGVAIVKQIFLQESRVMVSLVSPLDSTLTRRGSDMYYIVGREELDVDVGSTKAYDFGALSKVMQDSRATSNGKDVVSVHGTLGASIKDEIPPSTFIIVLPLDFDAQAQLKERGLGLDSNGNLALVDDTIFGVQTGDISGGFVSVRVLFLGEFYVGGLEMTYNIPTCYGHVFVPVTQELVRDDDNVKGIINSIASGFKGLVMGFDDASVITEATLQGVTETGNIQIDYKSVLLDGGRAASGSQSRLLVDREFKKKIWETEQGIFKTDNCKRALLLNRGLSLSATEVTMAMTELASATEFEVKETGLFPALRQRVFLRFDKMRALNAGFDIIVKELVTRIPQRPYPEVKKSGPTTKKTGTSPKKAGEPETTGEDEEEEEEAPAMVLPASASARKRYNKGVVHRYKELKKSIKAFITQKKKLEGTKDKSGDIKRQIKFLTDRLREMYAHLEEMKMEPAIIQRRRNYGHYTPSTQGTKAVVRSRDQENLLWKKELSRFGFPSMLVAVPEKSMEEMMRDLKNRSLPIPVEFSIIPWDTKQPVAEFKYDLLYGSFDSDGGKPSVVYHVRYEMEKLWTSKGSDSFKDRLAVSLNQKDSLPSRGVVKVVFDGNTLYLKYDLQGAESKTGVIALIWGNADMDKLYEKFGRVPEDLREDQGGSIFALNSGDYVVSENKGDANKASKIDYDGLAVTLAFNSNPGVSKSIEFHSMNLVLFLEEDVVVKSTKGI